MGRFPILAHEEIPDRWGQPSSQFLPGFPGLQLYWAPVQPQLVFGSSEASDTGADLTVFTLSHLPQAVPRVLC